jgi:hypothetical protein
MQTFANLPLKTKDYHDTVLLYDRQNFTSTAKGSEAAIALLPSVSYISRTPRLSQIYTITPLSNLNGSR